MRKAFCIAAIICILPATAAAQLPATLNAPYAMKTGDYAALLVSELFKANLALDIPKIVTYEPTPNTIDIELLGTRGSVEGARETINRTVQFIEAGIVPYLDRRLKLKTSKANFRIMYYDREPAGGPKLILTWDLGKLVVP
jgi:hypothetical protein